MTKPRRLSFERLEARQLLSGYSVIRHTDLATGNREIRMYYNGFHFESWVQTPQGTVLDRGHPNRSDPNAWGSSQQFNPFIAGQGIDATGGKIDSVKVTASGIRVAASGTIPSPSGPAGTWSLSCLVTYNPAKSDVAVNGAMSIALNAPLSGSAQLNVGRIDSNFLWNYSLNTGGLGNTGDMSSATFYYGADSLVPVNGPWVPSPTSPATYPQDKSSTLTILVSGQNNLSDPHYKSILKPTLQMELISASPATQMIAGVAWDPTKNTPYDDNVGAGPIVTPQNTSATDMVFQEISHWTTSDTTPPLLAANALTTVVRHGWTSPVLTGTVGDPAPSSGLAGVKVVVAGKTYTATVRGATWHVKITKPLAVGVYNVQVVATDLSGNTTTVTTALTVQKPKSL